MIILPNMSNVMGSGVGAFAGSPAAAGREKGVRQAWTYG